MLLHHSETHCDVEDDKLNNALCMSVYLTSKILGSVVHMVQHAFTCKLGQIGMSDQHHHEQKSTHQLTA
eukprot:1160449-Pelagomonas_calceolata.AAC.12